MKSQSRQKRHTHTLTLSLSLSLTHSLTLSHTLSLSLSHSLSHPLSLSHSLTHSLTHSHNLSLTHTTHHWLDFLCKLERLEEDVAVHLLRVVVIKRGQTREHLKQQRANRPPVNLLPVPLLLKNLWRHVLWRAAKRVGLVKLAHVLLTQAKVCELDVAVHVNENVLGLEVAVDDAVRVQVIQRCVSHTNKSQKGK